MKGDTMSFIEIVALGGVYLVYVGLLALFIRYVL